MRLATALALVLTPLLVIADNVQWHFETQSGRADGSGTKRCQKFYMKKQENFSFKMDKHLRHRSMRLRRAPEPQQNAGDWGNYPAGANGVPAPNGNGNNNYGQPQGYNPPNPGSYNPSAPGAYNPPSGGQQPPKPTNNNNNNNYKPTPPKPQSGGQWNGPTRPQEIPKCCLKMYTDDDCKDLDSEVCVEDKSDEKRVVKGKAVREFRGFNIACTPDPHLYD